MTERSELSVLSATDAPRVLDTVFQSRATDLARSGALAEAEGVLRPVLQGPDVPVEALDLEARICAQQGRLADAVRWWQMVLERDPQHEGARAGLRRANTIFRRPTWFHAAWRLGAGALTIAGCALVVMGLGRAYLNAVDDRQSRTLDAVRATLQADRMRDAAASGGSALFGQEQARSLRRVDSTLASLSRENAKLRASVSRALAIRSAEEGTVTARQRALAVGSDASGSSEEVLRNLQARVAALPGLRAWRLRNSVVIAFEEALFDTANALTVAGRQRLQALGGAIGDAGVPVDAEVVGVARHDSTVALTAMPDRSAGSSLFRAGAAAAAIISDGLLRTRVSISAMAGDRIRAAYAVPRELGETVSEIVVVMTPGARSR